MRPDQLQTPSTPGGVSISSCPTAERLLQRRTVGGAILLLPRTLTPNIARALDQEPVERLPSFRMDGRASAVMKTVADHLSARRFGQENGLLDWLVNDLMRLSEIFVAITGTEQIKLRLETVTDDTRTRFSSEKVRYRLVTTYRGAGTIYIDPADAARTPQGSALAPGAIRQLDRGVAAIFRGSVFEHSGLAGVLNRSPPIEATGSDRLFCAIDTLDTTDGETIGDVAEALR